VNIHSLPAGPLPTNAYLLTAAGEAVLIDAPEGILAEIEPILRSEDCRLKELWLTHGHWDHTQGAAEVVRATGARSLGHSADRTMYEHPRIMSAFAGGLRLEPIKVDRWIGQGERLDALGTTAEVRHVPGHCPGSLLFYFPDASCAFVGDALFQGGIGRTDLPGGDARTLERSIREQIYTLPGATAVYPGHGPTTTVAAEKEENPFVRG
jgi:hydroxyacylglutathione hydrolase